jgi:hypothetical protein
MAAPLEQCAELLGVDLDAIQAAAAHVEPYVRVDGTKVWSLMQLERQLRPDAYGRVRGGYLARRQPRTTGPGAGDRRGRTLLVLRRHQRPFAKVEGLFTVLMCVGCQAARGHGPGAYPAMTRAQMHESLALLPSWVLAQRAAANRQVIAVMRQRLAAGEEVARIGWRPRPGSARLTVVAEAEGPVRLVAG